MIRFLEPWWLLTLLPVLALAGLYVWRQFRSHKGAVLGLAFLLGQANEYRTLIHEGMTLSSGVFGSTFYTLTGFHGAHVAGGAAFILIVLLRARSGQFTARYHDTVEMASYYWHFVDVVWLGLFSTIYLLR